MRIDRLEIANFKIIRHLCLDNVPDLVVLAGPNGSGKTALFDALRVFKEAFAGYSARNPGTSQIHMLLPQVGPMVTMGENHASITVTIRVSGIERTAIGIPEDHGDVLRGRVFVRRLIEGQPEIVQVDEQLDPTSKDQMLLRRLFGQSYTSGGDVGVVDHIGPDRRFAAGSLDSINLSPDAMEIELQRLVLRSDEKFSTLGQDLLLMHFVDLQERDEEAEPRREYMQGVREIFSHFLPGTEFTGVRLPNNMIGTPRILVRSGGIEHDIHQLSSGQREILMTYAHLEKLRPSASIILFDEPELHLHPALQRRVIAHLMRLLERGHNQIWIITHSEEIVGTAPYDSLFAMTAKGAPAVAPVRDRAEHIELLQQLGASVGLQLTSPRILFLEGESDAELLPHFFNTLPAGVSLVDTGGKSNLMRLALTALGLLEETIIDGQFFMVRDQDVEDDPSVIDELQRRHANRFFAWDRYHIENYLLDEEAIHRVIADDPDTKLHTSVGEIAARLKALADERRDRVLALHLEARLNPPLRKRIRLHSPEGVKNSLRKAAESRRIELTGLLEETAIEQIYDEVAAELSRRWESEWKTLCVGRDVLKAYHRETLSKWHGYEVFRNSVARKIRDLGRVPSTVSDVMNAVTADLPPT